MNKIPTLYERDFTSDHGRYVKVGRVTLGCEWVFKGEGVPTRKYDGTCVMHRDGKWYARREVKKGKSEPAGFEPISTDPQTGKTVGWEPAENSGFARWLAEAVSDGADVWADGTYELCGPKVNGNPEKYASHTLIPHAFAERIGPPFNEESDPVTLVEACAALGYEGVVWHHPDGRMAKLKARDLRSV